jgi:hypothetical protein
VTLHRAMAIAGVLVGATGCYDPALRDCTVWCHGADQCASGQTCGADGWCVAAGAPHTCKIDAPVSPPADAPATPGVDAPVTFDAAPHDDAPADASGAILHITITNPGPGSVEESKGAFTCSAAECTIPIKEGVALTLVAKPSGQFKQWTGCPLANGSQCTITPIGPVTELGAVFK